MVECRPHLHLLPALVGAPLLDHMVDEVERTGSVHAVTLVIADEGAEEEDSRIGGRVEVCRLASGGEVRHRRTESQALAGDVVEEERVETAVTGATVGEEEEDGSSNECVR